MSTTSIVLNNFNASTSSNNQLTLNLPFPVEIKNSEVCLQSAFLYYSWNNITSAYSNNSVQYINSAGVTKTITFPNGFYTVSDINGFIQAQMFQNGDYLLDNNGDPVYYLTLQTNPVYYAVTLTANVIPAVLPALWTNPAGMPLTGTTMQLVIGANNFGKLIGFAPGTFPALPQANTYQVNSTLVPNISPVNNVNLNCSLVNNNRFNTQYPQTIYTFSSSVSYGSQIQLVPQSLNYYRVLDGYYNAITISFTDQNNSPLNIIDPNINVTLLIKTRE